MKPFHKQEKLKIFDSTKLALWLRGKQMEIKLLQLYAPELPVRLNLRECSYCVDSEGAPEFHDEDFFSLGEVWCGGTLIDIEKCNKEWDDFEENQQWRDHV